MNFRLALRLVFLVIAFGVVIVVHNYTSSGSFSQTLNGMFNPSQFNWCAEHVVDVRWVADVNSELKSMDLPALRSRFCTLKVEAAGNADPEKIQWVPLAESQGATGKKSVLEWNPELQLFKAGGMPFKSSYLSQILQK